MEKNNGDNEHRTDDAQYVSLAFAFATRCKREVVYEVARYVRSGLDENHSVRRPDVPPTTISALALLCVRSGPHLRTLRPYILLACRSGTWEPGTWHGQPLKTVGFLLCNPGVQNGGKSRRPNDQISEQVTTWLMVYQLQFSYIPEGLGIPTFSYIDYTLHIQTTSFLPERLHIQPLYQQSTYFLRFP